MGIRTDGKEITSYVSYGKVLAAICAGGRIIWEAIRSCFGAGWWANEKPWVDDDPWK